MNNPEFIYEVLIRHANQANKPTSSSHYYNLYDAENAVQQLKIDLRELRDYDSIPFIRSIPMR